MNIFNHDHMSLLEGALEDGVNFDVPYLHDQFPIHFVINTGRNEMFDLLVRKVDLNQRCILGLTPLHHALQEGNLHFIRELLRNGANPHKEALVECVDPPIMGRSFIEQSFYKTPMTLEFIAFMMENSLWLPNEIIKKAIMAKNEPLVLEMVKRSPLVGDDDTLIEMYCDTLEFPSVKEYLLNIDSEIEQKAWDYVRGLNIFDACKDKNLRAVKIFVLIVNIDINAKNIFSWTALHFASVNGHKEVVEFLVKNGCDINAKCNYKSTALYVASMNGHKEIVEFLIKNGCDISGDEDNTDNTALTYKFLDFFIFDVFLKTMAVVPFILLLNIFIRFLINND